MFGPGLWHESWTCPARPRIYGARSVLKHRQERISAIGIGAKDASIWRNNGAIRIAGAASAAGVELARLMAEEIIGVGT